MQADVHWLQRRYRQLRGFRGPDHKRQRLLDGYLERLAASSERFQRRSGQVPEAACDATLPIAERADEIVSAIAKHQVVVIAGETGSGKSTQIPKLCLAAGRGRRGLIGCTQPRRIAARSVARRVAEELGAEPGSTVGYQVRFSDRVGADSYIKFMTDGILLAEIHGDRFLDGYDTLIIDEAHERSLNIDFLLGYLKTLLPRRPDFKLIVTSATIDTERFARHFDSAPVIEVSGRGYPVDIEYQPPADGESLPKTIARAVHRLGRINPRGDILVFLPGEREIFQASRALRRAGLAHTGILPLYARLPAERQDAIFSPASGRRIVLATNVAETSLTVPGVRFVIDSGLARISRYASHSRVLRLPVEPVSKASLAQRAGRCGRVAPGVCIRLFAESDAEARPDYTEPEIQRAGLVGVVLEMLALKLGDPETFPFVDPPPRRLLGEAWQTLFELGAVDENRRLTDIGRTLARLPVDPRHGRILIEAARRGVLTDALIVVAALSTVDPRERPPDQAQAADQAHARFQSEVSDFDSLLLLWRWWHKVRADHSRRQGERLAREHFLSPLRLHEWGQVHAQLKRMARDEGWRLALSAEDRSAALHQALLAGLLGLIGQHHEEGEYLGARGHKFRIFPGSALARRRPGWLMAAELVETGRTYAHTVAPVDPGWIEAQAKHLTRHRYFDPYWDRKRGKVMGYEQVSLFGLVLVEKRLVHYGPHAPAEARSIFIRHALVRGEMTFGASFLARNAELASMLAEHEAKRRKRDVLAAESALEAFFSERLPEHIHHVAAFTDWYRRLSSTERDALLYDRATLLREQASLAGQDHYPDQLKLGGESFPLRYRFEPGEPDDGVTLLCPLHLVNRLDPGRLDWLVPGLLEEKIIALLGSLPKSRRRSLIPVADYARAIVEALDFGHGNLRAGVAAAVERMTGMAIAPDDFDESGLAAHLQINVRIGDEKGGIVDESRDIEALLQRHGLRARHEFMDRQAAGLNRDGLTDWEVGVLPPVVTTPGGHRAWPALTDQADAVGLRLFDTESEARQAHRQGLKRLLELKMKDKFRYLARNDGLSRQARLAWVRVQDPAELVVELGRMVLDEALGDAWQVRNREAFEELLDKTRHDFLARASELATVVDEVLTAWHRLRPAAERLIDSQPAAAEDITGQLDDLIYAGFLVDIDAERLGHYPRYLKAVGVRLEGLAIDPGRDRQRQRLVELWWQRYLDCLTEHGWYGPALDSYRWLVEEYRVQLFAQTLGTAGKVSEKRLDRAWSDVVSEVGLNN